MASKHSAQCRVRFSVEKKYEVIKYVQSGQSHSKAADKFGVSRTAVTKMIAESVEIEELMKLDTRKRKQKTVRYAPKFSVIEDILSQWHIQIEIDAPTINVTGEVLQKKALEFRDRLLLNQDVLNNPNLVSYLHAFRASNGWLEKYLLRIGTRSRRRCGEHNSVLQDSIDLQLGKIREKLRGVPLEHVWNLDETALQYRTTSSRSYVTINSDGRGVKRSKERITVTLVISASGEKLPLQVIGKSKSPRALKKIDVNNTFQIYYEHQIRAWQSTATMLQLFHRLNAAASAQHTTFYLLLDNCSSHKCAAKILDGTGSEETGFKFESLVIFFLPPNATSDCQPLDQGVIRSLKAGFRKSMLQTLLTEYELWQVRKSTSSHVQFNLAEHTHICNALGWLKEAYANVSGTLIQKCFVKANCLPRPNEDLLDIDLNVDLRNDFPSQCDSGETTHELNQSIDTLIEMIKAVQLSDLAEPLGFEMEGNFHDDICDHLLDFDVHEPTGSIDVDEENIISDVLVNTGVSASNANDTDDNPEPESESLESASNAVTTLRNFLSLKIGESTYAEFVCHHDVNLLLQKFQRILVREMTKEMLHKRTQSSIDRFYLGSGS